MKIKKLIPKKSEENEVYDCEKMKFLIKKKESKSKEHSHEKTEHIFLVEGKIKLFLAGKEKTIEAPVKIEIPANTKHKLIALTEIKLLYY